jgi:Flp pilus assembly protein TadD
MQVTLTINLRDSSGVPLDAPGVVNLRGGMQNVVRMASTQEASAAVFSNVSEGEYDAEARCVGYETTVEHLSVSGFGTMQHVYIYMRRENEVPTGSSKPGGTVMSPKLQAEIEKGLDALRKHQYDLARTHFQKGVQLAPADPNVIYLLGVAELGLDHKDLARQDFEHALSIDAGYERALLSLGELQLSTGDTTDAIATLEKAFKAHGAGWRTRYLLASAYEKAGRFADAETHAESAAKLVRDKSPEPLLLLGEIQEKEGKRDDAKESWQKVVTDFPSSPSAAKAKQNLATLLEPSPASPPPRASSPQVDLTALPLHALPNIDLAPPADRPWAPVDIDGREYQLAQDAPCQVDDVLAHAERRVRTQMRNFEKFAATEHIDHQEIDRYGRPGPVKSREFSYIVFVHPYHKDSFYIEEERNAGRGDQSFPTSLATVGLNNLGVSVLQPAERDNLSFRCEGLANVSTRAAWQIRFEENKGVTEGLRVWRRDGKLYHIPLKGRVWISSTSYDVLRVETDLREPMEALTLTRDHLRVDYGPVKFRTADTTLWLPLSAEMYMELRGRRYHHTHALSDYLLFEVDTNHKINKPKEAPTTETDAPQTTGGNG